MGEDMHISRRWAGDDGGFDDCQCTVLPCGHVSFHEANDNRCPQHCWEAARTIRRSHVAHLCGQHAERAYV